MVLMIIFLTLWLLVFSASITDADAGTPYEEAIFREPTADTAWQDSLVSAKRVNERTNERGCSHFQLLCMFLICYIALFVHTALG